MGSLRAASERLEHLYALELCRWRVRGDAMGRMLWGAILLSVAALAGEAGALVHALVGIATLAGLLVLPALYAGLSVWWEWAAGTAVWWVALPDAPWLRLAAKAIRGAVLGWGTALVGGLVYLVQFALRAALETPHRVYGGFAPGDGGVGDGTRWVLVAAVLAVPLALAGTGVGAWAVRLRGRSAGWLLWAPAAALALGGLAGAAIGLHAGLVLPGAGIAALLFWWACRWLADAPEVPGAGRG